MPTFPIPTRAMPGARFGGESGLLMWGTAATRPTADKDWVGWHWFSTDTDGGTLYFCKFEPGSGYSWQQAAAPLTITFTGAPPANASDTGMQGEIRMTSGFAYFCVGTNQWERVAISTW
jgi:hypothetical protein